MTRICYQCLILPLAFALHVPFIHTNLKPQNPDEKHASNPRNLDEKLFFKHADEVYAAMSPSGYKNATLYYPPMLSKNPEGVHESVPVAWQRPKGEVKGIFLFLNGCGGKFTEMFLPQDQDWGKPVMARQKLLDHGYLIVGVQGTGAHGKEDFQCTNVKEVDKIKWAFEYVKEKENVTDKPVIVSGVSAGAVAAPHVATAVKGKCAVLVSHKPRVGTYDPFDKNDVPANYPQNSPIVLITNGAAAAKRNTPLNETKFSKRLKERDIPTTTLIGTGEFPHGVLSDYNYLGDLVEGAIQFCENDHFVEIDAQPSVPGRNKSIGE